MKKLNTIFILVIMIISVFCYTFFVLSKLIKNQNSKKENIEILEKTTKDLEILNYLFEIKIQHPLIVYSQIQYETSFNSNLYNEHNNLFGMQIPGKRPFLGQKIEGNRHACYTDWKTSIHDYLIWQCLYAYNLTEEEYLDKLDSIYNKTNYNVKFRQFFRQCREKLTK